MLDVNEGSDNGTESGEDEDEEGDDDEFIDVLDVLDGRGVPRFSDGENENDLGTDNKQKKPRQEAKILTQSNGKLAADSNEDNHVDSDASEGTESASGDESEEIEAFAAPGSDEEADPSALDALRSFVTGLETGVKRKTSDEDGGVQSQAQAKKKKRFLKDRTEAGAEGEFGAKIASEFAFRLSLVVFY